MSLAIISGSTGSNTINILRGHLQPLKTRVDAWEVPGLDGYGALDLGQGDAESVLTAIVYVTDPLAAENYLLAMAAMQGTLVSITDNFGYTFNFILLKHVEIIAKVPVIYAGNASAVRLEIQLRCLST